MLSNLSVRVDYTGSGGSLKVTVGCIYINSYLGKWCFKNSFYRYTMQDLSVAVHKRTIKVCFFLENPAWSIFNKINVLFMERKH